MKSMSALISVVGQTQAGMQVLSAILFVSVFNRVIIEKVLSKITNTEHISVQSL